MDETSKLKNEKSIDLHSASDKALLTINKIKLYKIIPIILIFLFISFTIFYFVFIKSNNILYKYKFANMLPRIDLNDINYIPTISQLFNSRQLFISEANLSL